MSTNDYDENITPSEGPPVRNIGPSLRICQLNIEGISRAKCDYLSNKILNVNKIDVLALQETHTENEQQLESRGSIPGYNMVGATYHKHYGIATYVRDSIENVSLIKISTDNDIHKVIIQVGQITITNVYKPPQVRWPPEVLQPYPHPSIYLGDFNSHHVIWKYQQNDDNGEDVVRWSEAHNHHLIFDAKDHGTFRSAAWRQEYNPDLSFVSSNENNQPLPTSRSVIPIFPRSQHRPILLDIGISVPLITSFPSPRWNFKKANWKEFAVSLDKTLGWIPPESKNLKRFCGAVLKTAKKFIPRGYRKEYIPGWDNESESLYQQYLESEDPEIGSDLIHSLDEARKSKWTKTIEDLDFTRSSREAWSLLAKLGGKNKKQQKENQVHPNQVANHIVNTSRAPNDRHHTIQVKKEFKTLKSTCPASSDFSIPFSFAEVFTAVKEMKARKAPGFDGIHPEFLIHSGDYTKKWLAKFYTNIINTGNIPNSMKEAKIIALLKPDKPSENPSSYRPIALLSCLYKLLERLLFNRISDVIYGVIPIEQAGFRPGRSCADQVLSLTSHIEAGFQRKLKTSLALIDLSAAYDTVWRQGLLFKFLRVIPCMKTLTLLNNMLVNRPFKVVMGNSISSQKKLSNGLPQGSVLAPLLFSLYIADIPRTKSVKFGYADDWALATRSKNIEETENILTEDLKTIGIFFKKWRLKPNPTKTEVSCFHLANALANTKLRVSFENHLLVHNPNPKYLGVILDRTLSYKEHLSRSAKKLRTRNNIIQKLCGSTWGSSATVLRISALALVYSAAEYCAPVWLNSAHTGLVDVQLNSTMRMISGTIKPTPLHWLPVLSHIAPPQLRREGALVREYEKINQNQDLPVHKDIPDLQINRLSSRNPPLHRGMLLSENNFNISTEWETMWKNSTSSEYSDLPCIQSRPPGFDLPRKTWTRLNRIRSNCGRCADSLYKWGISNSPNCECGAPKQTVQHIIQECPRTSYPGPMKDFLTVTDPAISYINNLPVDL
ncbi:hypothetical protein M8J77_002972 [Diaphorina citri]|nr:hypothetical protein M8J77_002972 [Diaphorina citri]